MGMECEGAPMRGGEGEREGGRAGGSLMYRAVSGGREVHHPDADSPRGEMRCWLNLGVNVAAEIVVAEDKKRREKHKLI